MCWAKTILLKIVLLIVKLGPGHTGSALHVKQRTNTSTYLIVIEQYSTYTYTYSILYYRLQTMHQLTPSRSGANGIISANFLIYGILKLQY